MTLQKPNEALPETDMDLGTQELNWASFERLDVPVNGLEAEEAADHAPADDSKNGRSTGALLEIEQCVPWDLSDDTHLILFMDMDNNFWFPLAEVIDEFDLEFSEDLIKSIPGRSKARALIEEYDGEEVETLMVDIYGLFCIVSHLENQYAEFLEWVILNHAIPLTTLFYAFNPVGKGVYPDPLRALGRTLMISHSYRNTTITSIIRCNHFWFPMSQICEVLGIDFRPEIHQSALGEHLICPLVTYPDGVSGPIWLVDASGVRRLISMSKIDDAEDFERYFLTDLLPYCSNAILSV